MPSVSFPFSMFSLAELSHKLEGLHTSFSPRPSGTSDSPSGPERFKTGQMVYRKAMRNTDYLTSELFTPGSAWAGCRLSRLVQNVILDFRANEASMQPPTVSLSMKRHWALSWAVKSKPGESRRCMILNIRLLLNMHVSPWAKDKEASGHGGTHLYSTSIWGPEQKAQEGTPG